MSEALLFLGDLRSKIVYVIPHCYLLYTLNVIVFYAGHWMQLLPINTNFKGLLTKNTPLNYFLLLPFIVTFIFYVFLPRTFLHKSIICRMGHLIAFDRRETSKRIIV